MKTLALLSFGRTSSNVGIWYFGSFTASFGSRQIRFTASLRFLFLGSRQILILPGLANDDHTADPICRFSVFFTKMFFFSSSSNFALTSLYDVTAMRLGACMMYWRDVWVNCKTGFANVLEAFKNVDGEQ